MRGSHSLLTWPVLAAGPIAVRKCVTFAGLQAVADQPFFGVSRTSGVAGQQVSLDVNGILAFRAGGPIAVSDKVISDLNGDVVTAPGNSVNSFGRALNAAAQGEDVQILVR